MHVQFPFSVSLLQERLLVEIEKKQEQGKTMANHWIITYDKKVFELN